MMSEIGPSWLSLIAASYYLAVMGMAVAAAGRMTATDRQQGFDKRWLAIAAAFGIFAVLRFLAMEDLLRDMMRDAIASIGADDIRQFPKYEKVWKEVFKLR